MFTKAASHSGTISAMTLERSGFSMAGSGSSTWCLQNSTILASTGDLTEASGTLCGGARARERRFGRARGGRR